MKHFAENICVPRFSVENIAGNVFFELIRFVAATDATDFV